MNELQVFDYEGTTVRTVLKENDPWFVAVDVCAILDIANSRMAIDRLDPDEKGVSSMDTPGGKQTLTVINEAGLYTLVLGSRKPQAKAFKRWVTHEVIPSIRKHGAYLTSDAMEQVMNDPDAWIAMLTTLKEERTQREKLAVEVALAEPKVRFADSVAASENTILIGEMAKILKSNGMNIGQNRLFALLRNEGYLIKGDRADYNCPTQYAMNLGLFRIQETTVTLPSGEVIVRRTPRVTGKGQQYFVNRYVAKEAY